MRHHDDESFCIFLMWMFLALLFFNMGEPQKVVVVPAPEKPPATEEQMRTTGITCPKCLDIPEGMERLRQTTLLEGPTIALPTREYLEYLTKRLGEMSELGRQEYGWRLREVKLGEDDINSRVNPVYGRGSFTDQQLAYVKRGTGRTIELLERWERQFIGTKRDRFLRERHNSQGGLPPWLVFFIQKKSEIFLS